MIDCENLPSDKEEDLLFVYSKRIIFFIKEIKTAIKNILSIEVGLKVVGNRFFDHRQLASFPISVVIYNDRNMLGYFDSHFYELGFNEKLMHVDRKTLHAIIRHELAHYMCFMNHGSSIQSHGPEFRACCQKMGWGEEVYRATISLDNCFATTCLVEEGHVLRKIKKLMALTTSTNPHEAEQALIKSQQLLLKHHLEERLVDCHDDEKVFLKRILKQKKKCGKMRSIAKILETFFVNVVFHRSKEHTYLEIVGDAINIEIAAYVAEILESELDKLWIQAKSQYSHLKGMIAKNSFFYGVAKGYCDKIQSLKKEYGSIIANALIVLEKKLIDAQALAYGRLSLSTSNARYCQHSSTLGEKVGRQLTINPGVSNRSSGIQGFLGFN